MRLSGTRVTAIAQGRGFGNQLWDLAGVPPSLDMPFAETKSLVDATTGSNLVDFTRASSGTYVGSDGLIKTATTNEPRFGHDPTTGESLGLLVEEQRTNSIRNNTMVGAVVGTPGTLPTNWSTSLAGLTQGIVGTGTEKGVNYIDLRFSGISSATQLSIRWENTIVAVADGQTWSHSVWAKLVSGTLPSSNAVLSINLFNSSGTYLADFGGTQIKTSLGASLARVSGVGTINSATAALARPYLYFLMANGESVDFTIRLGVPQLEQGAFATSVIPTSGATVTRAADVASISGSNFSSWYRQDEGTVFADVPGIYNTAAAFTFSDGTNNNRILLDHGTNTRRCRIVTGGADQASLTSSYTYGSPMKSAAAYILNNSALANNGSLSANSPDTSCTIPTAIDRLNIGSNATSAAQAGTSIRRLTYWPTRLGNEVLQTITQ